MQPEEIIKRKIELVKQKRNDFIKKYIKFTDDLLITKHYDYGNDNKPSLITPSWIDNWLIKKLKIKDKLQKEYCKNLRFNFELKFKTQKLTDSEKLFVYNNTTSCSSKSRRDFVSDFSYKNWEVIEKFIRGYVDNRVALIEMKRKRREDERKVELCRLTKCFDEKVGTSLCDCGWVNTAQANYCAECGKSLI